MIYRIDIAVELDGWDAYSTKQLAWSAIAIVGAIAIVVLLRNYRVLFRYTYIFGLAGVLLLILPIVPGLGTDANADVWVSLGFFSFQPGELAKISLAIFFAGYLVRTRESLTSVGTRFLGLTWPRARELGPAAGDLAGLARHHRPAARPRHGPADLRHVRRDALRRHRQDELGA